jgi:hypothetical protein
MKNTMLKIAFLVIMLVTASLPLAAQIEGDPDAGSSIPIDGGIVTVTLIAAAYGAKRKRDANKDAGEF